jgi:glycosyltransferase involved in cell wall biosynthesis
VGTLMHIAFHAWRDLAHPQAGGSERLVDALASGLAARGHDVVLYAGSPVAPRAYHVVGTGGRFAHYLRLPLMHRRTTPKVDLVVDVVSGMTYFSPLWQSAPTVLLHTHVHVEQWRAMFAPPIAWVGRTIETRLLPRVYRSSTVVTISPSSAHGLAALGFDRSRLHILPVPVDARAHDSEPDTPEPLFVCVSRLVPYKRVDRLLDMWRRVQPIIGGTLAIVGDGPDLATLQQRAGPGVTFTGFVDDDERERLQRAAWLQVHPAAHEGWGLVITEAGVQGTPTLAYRVPGVRDAIVDGVTGVLVDDDEAFVKEWIDLAMSDDRRNDLGAGARALAARHTPEMAVGEFEDIALQTVRRSPR